MIYFWVALIIHTPNTVLFNLLMFESNEMWAWILH